MTATSPTSPRALRPDEARPIRRALLSVSDKTGLIDLARGLARHGTALVSTGASAGLLRDAGLAVTEVAEVTGSPEMLGGRVKTLHPRIHGGLLGRPDDAGHQSEMDAHGIEPFDLLVVNLYPFEATVASGVAHEAVVEQIDVGGPAMIRAGAKNHRTVAVLTDPSQYGPFLAGIEASGGTTPEMRAALARTAFARTAAYDAAIAEWMERDEAEPPARRIIAGRLIQPLRYGENPHQSAAFYVGTAARPGVATARQVQGKALSYNNILDADAAIEIAAEFPAEQAACVIVKHANPCGAALGGTLADAHAKALACDRTSAFGGIVAVNRPLDEDAARAIAAIFTEVVVAPGADDAALAVLAGKPNLRVLLIDAMPDPRERALSWRQVGGGFLVQDRDAGTIDEGALRVVTRRAPSEAEWANLRFAWTIARHVRSNAIVLAQGGATLGVGAGQMSRVDSVHIAARKMAQRREPVPEGVVLASDAFFPFADGLQAAIAAGVTAAIQPGGSARDAEVIAAADEAGLAMAFTAMRHFRH